MTQIKSNDFVRANLPKLREVPPEEDYGLLHLGARDLLTTIDDVGLMPELVDLLKTTRNDGVHHLAAWMLGHLWKNTRDAAVAECLVEQLLKRPKGDRAGHILRALQGPPLPDPDRLRVLLDKSHKKLWVWVLDVLKDCPNATCEDEVLSVLENSKSKYDRCQAIRALGAFGTAKSLPALEKCLFDKKEDVARPACWAIGRILGPQGCDFLAALMENPKYRYKGAVAGAMVRNCDATAVPAIIKRIEALTSRARAEGRDANGITELAGEVEFLERHAAGSSEVAKLYKTLKKRWRKLLACEREYLVAHVPAFADVSWRVGASSGALPASPDDVEEARSLFQLRQGHGVLTLDDSHPVHPLRGVVHSRDVDPDQFTAALRWFTGLEKLILGVTLRDEHLETLGTMTELKHLRLSRAGNLTDAGIRHLAPLKNLLTLELIDAQLTDRSLNWILSQWDLNTLTLQANQLSPEGCRRLMQLEKLTELFLFDACDAGVAGIENLRHLRWLRLFGSGVTDATLARLPGLASLSLLDLRDSSVTGAGLRRLAPLRQLRNLYLHGARVTPEAAASFEQTHPQVIVDLRTPRAPKGG